MSAPVQRGKPALVSILPRDRVGAPPAPPQAQSLSSEPTQFLGESQEAAIFARLSQGGLSSEKKERHLKRIAVEAAERLMARKLKFKINGEEIVRTVEQALQFYKRGFERSFERGQERPLPSAKLIGSSCPAFLGSRQIGECLNASLPEMPHIDKQISDVDFFLDMRGMSQDQEIAPALLQSIEEEFWWDRAAFKVLFNNGLIGQLRGFNALVDLFAALPDPSNSANWCRVNNIRTVKGPDLDERGFLPKHVKALIEQLAPFRENPALDRKSLFPLSAQIFQELYSEPLRVFIKRTAFDEWHYFQQHQRHRMSCRDEHGLAYDFTVQIEGEDLPPRMVYQEAAIHFTSFLNGRRELFLEASDLALALKLCRQKVWTTSEKMPRDFFYSQWMNSLGYRDVDCKSEEKLVKRLAEVLLRASSKSLMLAEMVGQELLARKCVEQGKERKRLLDLRKQLEQLVSQSPEVAKTLAQVIEEELEKTDTQLVSADGLWCNIQVLRGKSRWFDGFVPHLIDHLAGKSESKRSKECDPARTIAFLLNALANLPPECSDNEIFRLWFYLGPLIPTQFKEGSLFTCCHHAILTRKLTPRQISAALTLLSFEGLNASLQVRQKEYLQPTVEMHDGKPVIHLVVEGRTLQMSLDPAAALETLCTVSDKSSQAALQELLAFGKAAEKIDPASPLLKWKKELNLDYSSLCKGILKASENADPAIRALSHRLLPSSLRLQNDEGWCAVIAAIPALLHHASDKDERMRLIDLLVKSLNGRFGIPAMADLTAKMKEMAGKTLSLNELRQGMMQSLIRLRSPPFPQLVLDMWKSLDPQEKNVQAQILYEAWKSSLLAKAIEVVRWRVEENGLKGEEAGRLILEVGGCLVASQAQLIFDFADLVAAYSRHHQDPPASSLVLSLMSGPCWMEVASACESKGLLPKGPIAEAGQLFRHPQDKKNAERFGPVAGGLRALFLETRDPVLAAALMQFHEVLMQQWPPQKKAEQRTGYEDWVRFASIQRRDLVMEVLGRFSATGLFLRDRQGAKLLLDCCSLDPNLTVQLFRHAIDQGYWNQEDYQIDFDAYLKLYMAIRTRNKEAGLELRGYLLKAKPDHPQLNEEMRRKKFHELDRYLKASVPLPQQIASFRELLLLADPEKEEATVLKHATRLLFQIDPLEQIELLDLLHRHYPKCTLEPALSHFPISRASPEQLVTFAGLLDSSLESTVIDCIRRLIDLKEHQASLNLLERTQVADDSLWIDCLQAVANDSRGNHVKAWEVSLSRKKWERFARNPKGGQQVCANWLSFAQMQMQLLATLMNSGNRCQDWKGLLVERLKASRSPEDRHNAAYQDFMRTRLLKYLELLLPADMPHRYSRLYDEIRLMRDALPPGENFPDLDARRLRCSLRTGNPRHLAEAMQLLSASLEAGEDVDEIVLSAVKECSSCIPRPDYLTRALERLLGNCAGRSSPKLIASLVDLLLANKKNQALDLAVELVCRSPAQKESGSICFKLACRLAEVGDPCLQQLLSHCAGILTEEQLCTCICDYLDAVMRARKDPSAPIDTSGVVLCNAHLFRLSREPKLRCLDKALDHFCLIFDHASLKTWIAGMRKFLEEIERKHFYKSSAGAVNTILSNWLKKRETIETISVLSPRFLAETYMTCWMGALVKTSAMPEHNDKAFWQKLEEQLKLKFQAIEDQFVSLKIDLCSEQNLAFIYDASLMLVSKYLKRMEAPDWSGELLAANMWFRLEYFVQLNPGRHRDWMHHFVDWVFYPPAYARADYAKKHFSAAKGLVEMLKKGVFNHYPKERFELDCYLNYQVAPGIIEKTEVQQVREIKMMLERIWKHDLLRGSLHALYFIHFASVTFLLRDPPLFKKWYGRVFEGLLRQKDTSWDAFNLACHLRTGLKAIGQAWVQEMHGRHGIPMIQYFCDFVKQAAIVPQEGQEDKLATIASAAWDYFCLIKHKCGNRVNLQELDIEQMRLIAYLESGLQVRCEDPKECGEENTLKLQDYLYTLPYTPSGSYLQARYRMFLDEIKRGSSLRTAALLFAIAKDLERKTWGHPHTQEVVVGLHREFWPEMASAMADAFENGPLSENAENFSLGRNYFAEARAYLQKAHKLFHADIAKAEERLQVAYQQHYGRLFDGIVSDRTHHFKSVQHLYNLALDLENRGEIDAVRVKHRLHWTRIMEAYAYFLNAPIIQENEENIDILYVSMMYLHVARQRFMNVSNREDFVQQQQRIMASMPVFHQHFLDSSKVMRNKAVNLCDGEITYLMQLCRIGESLLDEVKSRSLSTICSVWQETVDYLCDRLRALPRQPEPVKNAQAKNASRALALLISPQSLTSQADYEPWLCTMSFLHAGRLFFAGCGKQEVYFDAIGKIYQAYLLRGNHAPDHYLYLFKLLTDEFPDPQHERASRIYRCVHITCMFRMLAESGHLYGQTAAVIYLKRRHALEQLFANQPFEMISSQEILAGFEKNTTKELLASMERVDLSQIKPDCKNIMIVK